MRARQHHRSLSPAISRHHRSYDERDIGRDIEKGREFEAVKTEELTAATWWDVSQPTTCSIREQNSEQGVQVQERPNGMDESFDQRKQNSAGEEEGEPEKDTVEDADVLAEIQKLRESRENIVTFTRERHLLEVFPLPLFPSSPDLASALHVRRRIPASRANTHARKYSWTFGKQNR